MSAIFLDHREAGTAESRDIERVHAVVQALGYVPMLSPQEIAAYKRKHATPIH
jgi:hypothetical protein